MLDLVKSLTDTPQLPTAVYYLPFSDTPFWLSYIVDVKPAESGSKSSLDSTSPFQTQVGIYIPWDIDRRVLEGYCHFIIYPYVTPLRTQDLVLPDKVVKWMNGHNLYHVIDQKPIYLNAREGHHKDLGPRAMPIQFSRLKRYELA